MLMKPQLHPLDRHRSAALRYLQFSFGIQVPDPAATVCCDRPWPPPRGPFAMLYLSSHNFYSMTTFTTASPSGATSLQVHDHTATLVRSARVL
jgi:hypothetical protein